MKILLLLLIFLTSPVYAGLGLSISTGGYEINITTPTSLGREVELYFDIYPVDRYREFIITKHLPSELSAPELDVYSDLPLEFLIIKSTAIVVNAGEVGRVLVCLTIPKMSGDYHVSICIREYSPTSFISLCVYPRIKITIPDFEEEIEADNNSDNSFNNHSSTDTNTPD